MAMVQLLKRTEFPRLAVHGFPSSYRDWATETTHYPNEVVEMALAHTIKNQAEAAYRRGRFNDKANSPYGGFGKYCALKGWATKS